MKRKPLKIQGAYRQFYEAISTETGGHRWMFRSRYILEDDESEPQSEIHIWLHSSGLLMTVWVHDDGGFQPFQSVTDDGTTKDAIRMAMDAASDHVAIRERKDQ